MLLGPEALEKLRQAHVAVFGLGGVGGQAAEALVRAGAGHLYICDYDRVAPSNANRQILAADSTMGQLKVEAARNRFMDINPALSITTCETRLSPENIPSLLPPEITHAVDAIDEINSKVALITTLFERGVVFISSMGAGNRMDSTRIKIDDISATKNCPLARMVRKKLREGGITRGVPCVYSTEQPLRIREQQAPPEEKKRTVGTISYMPPVFGLHAAGYIIGRITRQG